MIPSAQFAAEKMRDFHAERMYEEAENIVLKRFTGFAVRYFMDDPRIIELLTEMLQEQKQTNVRLEHLEKQQDVTNSRLERLEKQQQTTNLKLQELTLSNVRLADELKIGVQYGERIVRLEQAVFH